MRPSTLTTTLQALIRRGRNVMIEGSPGLGKTELTKQAIKSLGPTFHTVFKHGPTMQPEDLALPFKGANGRLDFLKAGWIPLAGDFDPEHHVVVVIDELAQASNEVQKTLANLMQEREAYGDKLHANVSFICTGNRTSDRAGASRILSHLRNRMVTLEFEPSLDDWCAWALDHDVRPEIISLMRFKPGLLNDFDPNRDINPTPRAWAEQVSGIVNDVEDGAIPMTVEFETIKGAVGEGAASECCAFLKIYRKLPNPDVVLMQPETTPVPEEPSVRFALAGAIAHRASVDNFDAVMKFARRLPAEFTVLIVLDSVRKCPEVQSSKSFLQWAATDGAKVLI